jgi:hypothetical protein
VVPAGTVFAASAECPRNTFGDRSNLRATPTQSAATSRLARRGPLSDDEAAFLSSYGGRQATVLHAPAFCHGFRSLGNTRVAECPSRFIPRQRKRSPDRKASRDRRRKLGGSSALPDTLRHHYTEGQRSVLCIVSGEVKRHGICDLVIDKIAALAGVCRTTVQTTMHEARRLGHIRITERPRRGEKSLPNLVEIFSEEWRAWIKRAPSPARALIGSNPVKMVSTTKNTDLNIIEERRGSENINPTMIANATAYMTERGRADERDDEGDSDPALGRAGFHFELGYREFVRGLLVLGDVGLEPSEALAELVADIGDTATWFTLSGKRRGLFLARDEGRRGA